MRSDKNTSAPLGLKVAAGLGLAFLHLPILLIFLYAFTTEEKSYQFPPPGYTLQWFAVAWNRPDVWEAMGLSVRVASISTAIALVLGCGGGKQPRAAPESVEWVAREFGDGRVRYHVPSDWSCQDANDGHVLCAGADHYDVAKVSAGVPEAAPHKQAINA